jgi:hypothetical protein
MIKTILSHYLIEYAIKNTYDNVIFNFITMPNVNDRIRANQHYSEITKANVNYYSMIMNDATIIYVGPMGFNVDSNITIIELDLYTDYGFHAYESLIRASYIPIKVTNQMARFNLLRFKQFFHWDELSSMTFTI